MKMRHAVKTVLLASLVILASVVGIVLCEDSRVGKQAAGAATGRVEGERLLSVSSASKQIRVTGEEGARERLSRVNIPRSLTPSKSEIPVKEQ